MCPLGGASNCVPALSPPSSRKVSSPPTSSISRESPGHVQEEGSHPRENFGNICERPFPASSDLAGQFTVMGADSVVMLDAGTAAILFVAGGWNAAILFRIAGVFPVLRPIQHSQDPSLVTVAQRSYAAQQISRREMLVIVANSRLLC